MAYAIRRDDNGTPTFFSLKIGRDYGNPAGGWTHEPHQADKFPDEKAALAFIEKHMDKPRMIRVVKL